MSGPEAIPGRYCNRYVGGDKGFCGRPAVTQVSPGRGVSVKAQYRCEAHQASDRGNLES